MDIFDSRYYRSCKILMGLIGLWPYQTNLRRRLSQIVYYVFLGSMSIPLLTILWKQTNFTILVESGISGTFTIVCITKYSVSYYNASRFKQLFAQIAKDWKKITDQSEIDILSRHSEEGRFLVVFYTIYSYYTWVMYSMMPFLPPFLDLVSPLKNGTRDRMLPFYGNYIFFDQADYYYESCMHVFVVYFYAATLFAGIDTIYVAAVKHTCGLFAIVSHRLENMAKIELKNKSMDIKDDTTVHHDLMNAIVLHNETMRCCSLLEDSFSFCFFVIQLISVLMIAAGGCYIIKVFNEIYTFLRVTGFVVGTVIHVYYLNWVGQLIIDSSAHVFDSAYFSQWYLISPRSRKLTNIIMMRSLYPCQLTAGKIMAFSMESFSELMKTAMSYFTVIMSMA